MGGEFVNNWEMLCRLKIIGKRLFHSDFGSRKPRRSPKQHQTMRKPRPFTTKWNPLTAVMVREIS